MKRWLVTGFLFGALMSAGPAAAHDPLTSPEICPATFVGCEAGDVSWYWRRAAFDSVMFDSGWVPAGAPVQLRFAFFLGGETVISMDATGVASWPFPLSTRFLGHPESGGLSINYGVELIAQMRFDFMWEGARYHWEGDIPLGDFPRDLRMADSIEFDPLLLPPSMPRPVEVFDTTERFTAFEYDAIGSFVSVPGVGGGVRADVQGGLTARYRTNRVVVEDGGEIVVEEESTIRGPRAGEVGFGPSADIVAHPEGTLEYEGTLTVWPVLYIDYPGGTYTYDIAEIPIPIYDDDTNVIFDDDSFHVPLPDIDVDPTEVAFGEVPVGVEREETIRIANGGEAELEVMVTMLAAPFGVSSSVLRLPPSSERVLAIRFRPEDVGPAGDLLRLTTNDPDEPEVIVRLSGSGAGSAGDAGPSTDAGPGGGGASTEGGCGCHVPGRARAGQTPLAAAALAALVAIRAWRSRRRSG